MKHYIYKFRSLMSIALLVAGVSKVSASELYNLPNVSGLRKIGEAYSFETPKKIEWILPLNFSHELKCSEGVASSHVSCQILVYNRFSSMTQDLLKEQENAGKQFSLFRDIDTRIVNASLLELSGEILKLIPAQGFQPNVTLQMDQSRPYQRIAFRVTREQFEGIKASYYSPTGLGELTAIVYFNGESVREYLAWNDLESIQNSLIPYFDKEMKFAEAYSLLRSHTERLKPKAFQIVDIPLDQLLLPLTITKVLKRNSKSGAYFISQEAWKEFVKNPVLIDSTRPDQMYVCRSILLLSSTGQSKTECSYAMH